MDAESDDGRHQITAIVFVGSVFSPYYALARRSPGSSPYHHAAVNVALSGPKRRDRGWAFVESALANQDQSPDQLRLGRSHVSRQPDGSLTIVLDAPRTAFDRPVRGRITLTPERAAPAPQPQLLDAAGAHAWWPVMPTARVEVAFEAPNVRWRGRAYHDTNWGTEPLEDAFVRWQWMRTLRREHTEVTYVAQPKVGGPRALARAYAFDGGETQLAIQPAHPLPTPVWRVARSSYGYAKLMRTLLDSPFYVRSRLRMANGDIAMHEALDMQRWKRWWTQALMRFRLRRLR